MALTGRWYDDAHTLFYLTFSERWTAEMYRKEIMEGNQMIEREAHPVDVIMDLSDSGLPPLNVYHEIHATHQQHAANLRHTIIVVSNPIVRNAVAFGIRSTRDENFDVEVVASSASALTRLECIRREAGETLSPNRTG